MKNNFKDSIRFILLFMVWLFSASFAFSDNEEKKVLLMKIDSEIDPRTNRYSELALDYAKEIEADLVILELDTYGGAVNDADDIRTRMLEFDKPIWVFINRDAASAGALISIACDSIYMASGASIGAATVVVATGEAAPDKYQSYMRSIMRSTAEANGRNPQIAEAMVDQEIAIDSITEAGNVLTFSTSEAIKHNFCEAEVKSVEEILERNGIEKYELVEFELNLSERIIRIFLNPFVSGILILVIIGGIYFELQTPGVGFPILASIIAAVFYFVPYYLNGLAANWEIIVFFVGITLLLIEVFVLPGFGVAGIGGILLIVGSLILVMLNNDFFDFSFVNAREITKAAAATLSGLLASILLMFFGGVRLTQTNVFKRISLEDTQKRSDGYTSNFDQRSYMGLKGTTYTVLRPSGKIFVDGELKDAFTRGEFIEKDKKVEVIDESGTSLKVKEIS
ncbi:MAG: nodulation protein NfeD [Cyclobacteriaceae bacterium]|nr:nodulation protein NfeD [Cyclobacteriaceae bacterium]